MGGLSDLQIDKVAGKKGISKQQLEEGDIPEGLRVEIKSELGSISRRWESSREEDANQGKRPLLTSQERSDIEMGTKEGAPPARWGEWLNKSIAEQWEWLGSLGVFPLRRPAMNSTEELGGRE